MPGEMKQLGVSDVTGHVIVQLQEYLDAEQAVLVGASGCGGVDSTLLQPAKPRTRKVNTRRIA